MSRTVRIYHVFVGDVVLYGLLWSVTGIFWTGYAGFLTSIHFSSFVHTYFTYTHTYTCTPYPLLFTHLPLFFPLPPCPYSNMLRTAIVAGAVGISMAFTPICPTVSYYLFHKFQIFSLIWNTNLLLYTLFWYGLLSYALFWFGIRIFWLIGVLIQLQVSSYCYICVLILLYI
jgi:hypothetical protein